MRLKQTLKANNEMMKGKTVVFFFSFKILCLLAFSMKQENGQENQRSWSKHPLALLTFFRLPSVFPGGCTYLSVRPSFLPHCSQDKKEVLWQLNKPALRTWRQRDDYLLIEWVLQVIVLLLAFALAAETCLENNNNKTIQTVCSCWQNKNSSEITLEEDEQESDPCLRLIFQILPKWLGLKKNGRLALTCIYTYRLQWPLHFRLYFSSTPLSK